MKANRSFFAAGMAVLLFASASGVHGATQGTLALKQIAEGFTSPVVLLPYDENSGRLLVADQIGTISVLAKDGAKSDQLFFDVRSRLCELTKGFDERGLLGLALHPKFADNRRLFLVYSAPRRSGVETNWNHTMTLSEFKVLESDRLKVDPASERVVLQIDKPYFNHNGGCIAFGPDGYLYLSVGDGGNANDLGLGHSPQGNGQDLTKLLGKMLRLDVNQGNPYVVPPDNPFVGNAKARPEIFAYGLRNSWRMSFDRGGKHELFAADVGQNMFEEVNIIVKGGNYGWNVREGFHCFDPKNPNQPPTDCPTAGADGQPFIDPIFEYKNFTGWRKDPEARGVSVTGGFVYRGKVLPELVGRYVFGDWSRAMIKPDGVLYVATRPAAGGKWSMEPLDLATHPGGAIGAYVTAFGQDAAGELYVLTNGKNAITGETGKVFKLVRGDR